MVLVIYEVVNYIVIIMFNCLDVWNVINLEVVVCLVDGF